MNRHAVCAALAPLLLAGCADPVPEAPATVESEPAAVATPEPPPPAPEPLPDVVRVRLDTAEGAIIVAVDARRAPVTAANFVRYASEGRFDGAAFYRAAPTRNAPDRGFIQGGIRRDYRRMLPPIAHEPTSQTGLKHGVGTISMARSATAPATGDFFITTAALPSLDATAKEPGFAVFGRVVEGMDVVRRILAAPTTPGAGRGAMKGQMLAKPVRIDRATRLDDPKD